MPVINAIIGPYNFFAAQYTLTTPQREYMRIDEKWENGLGWAESGLKSGEETIITWADFLSALEAKATITAYSNIMRTIVNMRFREGNDWIDYYNFKILRVKDITEQRWSPTVSGGMVGGQFERITEWTVQNMTGVW